MKLYILAIVSVLALVAGGLAFWRNGKSSPLAQPAPSPKKEIVIANRLRYVCGEFKPQVKTIQEIIALKMHANRVIFRERKNIAFSHSLHTASETGDILRLEQMIVEYECDKS
jgi:hypothetical protein